MRVDKRVKNPDIYLFRQIGKGATFKYPDGDKIYMKIEKSGKFNAVKLDDGQTYYLTPDKEIILEPYKAVYDGDCNLMFDDIPC